MSIAFQDIILKLYKYWSEQGCAVMQASDQETGAGTFNPATFFGVLGPNSHNVCYVEPSRRPTDGRYGENPNRLYQHHQFQMIMKPAPENSQDLYLKSLEAIGIVLNDHDIRFIEDNWESPTLGATGLGWEVWLDGMEITQFTYFQQVGGFELDPISLELTYGLERIAMFLQEKDDLYDLVYTNMGAISYKDIFQNAEYEFSKYSFEVASISRHFEWFDGYEAECLHAIEKKLVRPAYDMVLKASHTFNVLDARNAISVTERVGYIARIRILARKCAEIFMEKYHGYQPTID
jgi:glycyl-tRNA synthetase alpha chain